ncbi:MAG TPA: hypothetical protein VFK56_10850 [Mycobacterium sp.]|nr:hypothetical protein [Mycobacterium sp.]
MASIIALADLPASIQDAELIDAMIDGANAKASRVAPCLTWDGTDTTKPAPTADQLAEAKLVLIGAVKRWVEAGSGALQSQTIGPFGQTVDTRQKSSGFNLWPSEIEQLQEICANGTTNSAGAFSITPAASTTTGHAPWCALNFGANYCSCGADIAGYPIFEVSGGDYY